MELVFGVFIAFLVLLSLVLGHHQHEARVNELRTLARSLEVGEAGTPTGLFDGISSCSVRGGLDGHRVRVGFERRGGKHKRTYALHEVDVMNPAATFDVAEAGALDHLGRWLGLATDDLGEDDLVLRRGAQEARRLIQAATVKAAIRAVLDLPGVSAVSLQGGTLRIDQRLQGGSVDAADLRHALEVLVRLARQCGRVPVQVKVSPRGEPPAARFAWTDGGGDARCPYCRDGLDPAAEATDACPRCGTVHHRACLAEAGGCTVFGCGARSERARA